MLRTQLFQSPRTWKFESNWHLNDLNAGSDKQQFQSPRTGKFESNPDKILMAHIDLIPLCFNPLERGNSNQIFFEQTRS